MKKITIYLFLFWACILNAQTTTKTWAVKLSSHVEHRTWKLTFKSDKDEKSLPGASLVLTKQGKVVLQSTTDASGDFTIMVPGNDVFILTVSYPGCNPKKITIITTGVPEEIQNNNFYPSFGIIGGFVMAKPFPGIDYSGLQEPLIKVVYSPKIKNFDDDPEYTAYGTGIVAKIRTAEDILIDKFCGTNKRGDAALAIPDCPLAKRLYNEAIALIPGEEYPVIQLAKVPDCDKIEEEKKKAAEDAKKAAEEKALADKAAKDKAAADKAAANQAAKDKVAADKLAKQKAAEEKAAAAKTKTVAPKPVPEKKPVKKPVEKTEETAKNKMPDNDKEIKKHEYETKHKDDEPVIGHGDSKYKKPQVLGADKYKETLNKAEGYFKMKRWSEAKTAYEDVLKIKAGDPYATNKLAEVNKMLSK